MSSDDLHFTWLYGQSRFVEVAAESEYWKKRKTKKSEKS